jgi:hypothetical protein
MVSDIFKLPSKHLSPEKARTPSFNPAQLTSAGIFVPHRTYVMTAAGLRAGCLFSEDIGLCMMISLEKLQVRRSSKLVDWRILYQWRTV